MTTIRCDGCSKGMHSSRMDQYMVVPKPVKQTINGTVVSATVQVALCANCARSEFDEDKLRTYERPTEDPTFIHSQDKVWISNYLKAIYNSKRRKPKSKKLSKRMDISP